MLLGAPEKNLFSSACIGGWWLLTVLIENYILRVTRCGNNVNPERDIAEEYASNAHSPQVEGPNQHLLENLILVPNDYAILSYASIPSTELC